MMQIHFLVAMDTLGKISHGKRSVWVRGRGFTDQIGVWSGLSLVKLTRSEFGLGQVVSKVGES